MPRLDTPVEQTRARKLAGFVIQTFFDDVPHYWDGTPSTRYEMVPRGGWTVDTNLAVAFAHRDQALTMAGWYVGGQGRVIHTREL